MQISCRISAEVAGWYYGDSAGSKIQVKKYSDI
jgi:hypothetical protein